MTRNWIPLGLLISVVATDVSAQAVATAVPPPEIVVTGKKVCRRDTKIGSIIPTRICKTQQEWDAEQERAQAMLGQMRDDQMYRDNAQRHKAESTGG